MFTDNDVDMLLAKLRVDKSPAGRGIMSYADGGPVDDDTPTMSMEEIQRLGGTPVEDEGHDDIPTMSLADIQRLGGTPVDEEGDKPAPEGMLATGAREAAHAAVPAAASIPAGMAGFELGAAAGAPLAPLTYGLSIPIGGILGAAGLAGGAGYLASKAQEATLDATGLNDTEQRQANREANPNSADIGALVPQAAALKFTAAPIVERVLMGGVGGALSLGQQAASGEDIDYKQVAEQAALGAAMPRFNRAGEALAAPGRYVGRWRPGMGGPAGDQAKTEAAQSEPTKNTRGAAVEQPPPQTDNQTSGNPQSAPTRSSREYPKDTAGPASNPDDTGMTKGVMAPDVESALGILNEGGEPAPAAAAQEPAQPPPEQQAPQPAAPPVAANPENFPPPQPARVDQNPVTDAFRAAGKEVPGANFRDLPPEEAHRAETPGPAAPEDAGMLGTEVGPNEVHAKIDEAASETHPQPSDKQIEAENFQKGHIAGADVGLPGYRISTETERGGVRSSKPGAEEPWEVKDFPYHYGHILGTTGADGDPMDIAIDNTGKKKFIVDQLDAETGKFDEHKIFANTSDEDRVRELYNKGFTDGKGPERLGAVTEVDTDALKDFLKNGDETKPFNPNAEQQAKEIKPRTKVDKVIQALRDKNDPHATALADGLATMSGDAQLAAVEKVRKAILVKRPTLPGTKVQVRSGPDGARKTAALKAYQDAFDKFPLPSKNAPQSAADIAALRDRVTAAVTQANNDVGKIDWEGKRPYLPNDKAISPGAMWLRAAKDLLSKKNTTPAQAAEFHAAELALRAGTPEDLANERDKRKIEGNIARSRRSGDTAVGNAEADAASKAPFEVPHEEMEADTEPTPVRNASELPPENTRQLDLDRPEDAAEASKLLNEGVPEWKKSQAEQEAADRAKTERLKAARLAAKGEEKIDLASADHEEEAPTTKASLAQRAREISAGFIANDKASLDLRKVIGDTKAALKEAVGAKPRTAKDVLANAARLQKQTETNKPGDFFARKPNSDDEAYARSVASDFAGLKQENDQMKGDLYKVAKKANNELVGESKNGEALFHALDSRDRVAAMRALPPEVLKEFERVGTPLDAAKEQLFNAIKALDPTAIGPKVTNHMYRILLNHESGNKIDQTNLSADPIEGRTSAIGTRAQGTALERQFYALERQDGKRFVISPNEDGFTVWQNGKPTKMVDPAFEFKDGETYTHKALGTNKFTMDQSTVKEIEQHGLLANGEKPRYSHNPMLSLIASNAELGAQARNLEYMQKLKDQIIEKRLGSSRYVGEDGRIVEPATRKTESGEEYRGTALKNFSGWKLHPMLADVMDDYAQPGFQSNALERVSNLLNAATKSIFLAPVVHGLNEAGHGFIGRGWDNFNPLTYGRLLSTSVDAIKSVWTQDPFQKLLREHNTPLLHSGVFHKDFIPQIAKQLGSDIEKNPARWGKFMKTVGLNKPADLVHALYDLSSRGMWFSHDVFATQMVKEQMAKGASMDDAITHTFKHLPSYRVPFRLMGGGANARVASQTMQARLPFVFGRYHAAVWNAYANEIKDVVSGPKKVEALGHLMSAFALMAFYAYPMKKLAEKMTGNSEASFRWPGPGTVPQAAIEAAKTGAIARPLQDTMSLNPGLATLAEVRSNKDYNGKDIVEPGRVTKALHGSIPDAIKAVGEEGEHLARGFVAPYNAAVNAWRGSRSPAGAVGNFVGQQVGLKNPSPQANKWMATHDMRQHRDVLSRQRHPQGMVEDVLNHILK